MRLIKQFLGTLATGYILMFYSEFLFWARVRPEDSLSEWVSTWLLYSLLAYVLLSMLARFHVASAWALFLAGACFGWLIEGVIVQTAYDALPLSLSFTGLAWHALVSVWVGFYGVSRGLVAGIGSVLAWSVSIGTVYGFWSIAWWVEPDGGMVHPRAFASFSIMITLLLMIAYWVYGHTIPNSFRSNRTVEVIVSLLLVCYFIFVTIPIVGFVSMILPILLLGLLSTLRHNKQVESGVTLLKKESRVRKVWHYLGLLALPLTASLFYIFAFALGIRWHTNRIVYLVTTPAGFILLIVSCIKIWRMKPALSVAD
ncbi:MAG: hypothetical protein JXR84_05570 [Anaerolineae bacterium]|nr:hypothetical protein [Anaerolineae bacterium]